ncbi:MAG: replicative DNA helicase, partial [Gammaproteobacteria bacterium]|nr:replicative DNA helicase [Gammaproteobacteria bacterium]
AEQALLGCLVCENSSWDRIADLVAEPDFAISSHRAIFAEIAAQAARNDPFDVVTLADRIEAAGRLEEIGGLSALGLLVDAFTTSANILSYARIVRDQSVLRRTVQVAEEVSRQAHAGEGDPIEILESAQQMLGDITDSGRSGGLVPLRVGLGQAILSMDEACRRGEAVVGVPSGFADLDRMTSGFGRQDLVILAARPSMGKTALALSIADHVSVDAGRNVAFFSLEMSSESLGMRLISMRTGVDLKRIRQGDLTESEWSQVTLATSRLSSAPMYIDDSASLTMTEITARARRIHREHPLSLIIVDYLQLIGSAGRHENRNVEVMKISQGLKALAKSLNVPVIALSQLSRQVEQRPNKRPMMSDIRDSGGIEQDADLILFIYRDEVYNENSSHEGTAEIIVAKQRNGPTGVARMAFMRQYCRFGNLSQDWAPIQRDTR